MRIEQYIYTRLSAAQSPKGTTGFQSAFLPAGLAKRLHAVTLESHIHLPEAGAFIDKCNVFWVEIDRAFWQVVLFVSSLPEARDEFGRAGISLVHGFLLPPELWTRYRNPLRICGALEEHRLHSFEAVLASPLVDRSQGLIAPLTLGVLPADDEQGLTPPQSTMEREALLVLYRIAQGSAQKTALVVKALPHHAELLFDRLLAWLPTELKVRIAWDSSFEAGKVFFAPMNLVAYMSAPPVTGQQALILPGKAHLDFTDDTLAALATADDPFTQWLSHCLEQSLPTSEVDAVYQASRAFRDRLPFAGKVPGPAYARINQPLIREWIRAATDPMLPSEWRQVVAAQASAAQVEALALAGFSDRALAKALADAILDGELLPAQVRTSPPGALLRAGEPRLCVLASMWTKEEINPHHLLDIVIQDRERILILLARNGMRQEDARALGFTEDEMQVAGPHFVSGFGRMVRKFFGR